MSLWARRCTRRLLPAGWIVILLGCGVAEARSGLRSSYGSPEALVAKLLEAVRLTDGAAMQSLLVTETEHHELLWDQLPESKTWPFAYVRELNERNTRKGLRKALTRYGGQEFEFVRLEFTRDSEVYADFTLHRGARLTVRRLSDGMEGELPIVDVFLERRGRWKLMDYEE